MKIHQIIASDGDKITYKDVSCFCEPLRGNCSCFSPRQHNLRNKNSIAKKSMVSVTKRKVLDQCDIPGNNKHNVESSPNEENKPELVIDLQNSPLVEPSDAIVNDCVEIQNELNARPGYTLHCDIITQPPVESAHVALLNETTLFDTADMEDFVDCSSGIIDSDLDIDVLPLVILPEKISTSPGPSTKADKNYQTPSTFRPSKKLKGNDATKSNKNKIKFQICSKCSCSILGQKSKCLACKQFYCEDCTDGPAYFDYICDNCFQNSD